MTDVSEAQSVNVEAENPAVASTGSLLRPTPAWNLNARSGSCVPCDTSRSGVSDSECSAIELDVIPIEKVAEILCSRGIGCSTDAALEALRVVRERNRSDNTDVSKVTSGEVDLMYAYMSTETKVSQVQFELGKGEEHVHELIHVAEVTHFFGWLCHIIKRKCHRGHHNQVYESSLKPTDRLVLVVVIMSFIVSLAVAGLAMGLVWVSAVEDKKTEIAEIASLFRSSTELFSFDRVQATERAALFQTTDLVSDMIRIVAIENSYENTQQGLLNAARLVGGFINSSIVASSESKQLNLLMLMKYALERSCLTVPNTTLLEVMNVINSGQIQPMREFVVSQVTPYTTEGYIYLTDLLFRNNCLNRDCKGTSNVGQPTRLALKGLTGTLVGYNYVHELVYASYTYVRCLNWGLVLQVPVTVIHQEFLQEVVDAVNEGNRELSGQVEVMVLKYDSNGTLQCLSSPRFISLCSNETGCLPMSETIMSTVMNETEGWREGIGYLGNDVLIGFSSISAINATLVVKMSSEEVQNTMVEILGTLGSAINSKLNGTLEMRLAVKTVDENATVGARYISDVKFPEQCVQPCSATKISQLMYNAAVLCEEGQGTMKDYRDREVLVGYACISELHVGLSIKIDLDEITNNSLAQAVEYANRQNSHEDSSLELLVAKAKGLQFHDANDFEVLSDLRYKSQCNVPGCWGPGSSAKAMLLCLDPSQADSGLREDYDYRPVATYSAWEYARTLAIGLVVKVDVQEVQSPILTILWMLIGTALGVAVLGNLILAFASKKLLHGMVNTWERGKKTVEQQKETYGVLVAALYPKFASERLLDGDTQIVVEVPDVSIMFSEINSFGNTAAHLKPTELVDWLTYIFSVMDAVAEYYHVYKIKTVGDAYFAIAGLLGLAHDGFEDTDGHSMRMVNFVSNVAQIFSPRYTHPEDVTCLDNVSALTLAVHKQEKLALTAKTSFHVSVVAPAGDGHSVAPSSSSGHSGSTGASANNTYGAACVMKYGIADGPVTAGVLAGKCPAFDVWGSTVNLAARMKATGQPFKVHCSESVFRHVSDHSKSPYEWEEPHSTFAKGFGNISTYFIRGTYAPPPKELLQQLNVDAFWGYHDFAAVYAASSGHGHGHGHGHEHTHGSQSSHESH